MSGKIFLFFIRMGNAEEMGWSIKFSAVSQPFCSFYNISWSRFKYGKTLSAGGKVTPVHGLTGKP